MKFSETLIDLRKEKKFKTTTISQRHGTEPIGDREIRERAQRSHGVHVIAAFAVLRGIGRRNVKRNGAAALAKCHGRHVSHCGNRTA